MGHVELLFLGLRARRSFGRLLGAAESSEDLGLRQTKAKGEDRSAREARPRPSVYSGRRFRH